MSGSNGQTSVGARTPGPFVDDACCRCCRLCRLDAVELTDTDRQTSRDTADHIGPDAEPGDGSPKRGVAGVHEGHDDHGDHAGHELIFRRRFWVCLVLSVPVLIWSPTIQDWFSYTAPDVPGSFLIVPVIASVIFVYGGLPFLQMATWELSSRRPAMMTLISLAIVVAYLYSMATEVSGVGDDFFWELVTLIDIMLLGHWLEMRSVRQASGALDALAKLMPDTADVVLPDGSTEQRGADELVDGDVVLVRPGASAPADGRVTEGASHLNESMITGESRPIAKSVGEQVIAGTVNSGNGSLRVRVTATGDDTTLAGIMALVAEAQASKSSTELLADRAAALLFYASLGAAIITAVVWTIVDGSFDGDTVARVVTVLIIACPHALGLAIPLVVANTTDIAARHGTLIRRREAIDSAKDLDIIAFDKTGTLTAGEVGVVDIATASGRANDRPLAIAASVEGDSEHPLAAALRAAASDRDLHVAPATGFEILKGRGVRATVDGNEYYVGGPRLLESLDVSANASLDDFSRSSGRKGHTVVYLADSDSVRAAFSLADMIRPESRRAVAALHEMNIEVAMLTGDSHDVAESVANELGIDRFFSQVLPEDKDEHVAALQRTGHRVGMVGDGVNDAPALTRADIGIAIGSGTDVAVQSADLVLVNSNPLDVPRILRLSLASYRKQLQNIWWGAGYNIVMVPLAAGVLAPIGFVIPPAIGAVVMSISTIVVAINAQLLRRVDLSI